MSRSNIIGERRRELKSIRTSSSSSSAEARVLSRLLNQLESASVASEALAGAVSQVRSPSSERDKVSLHLKGKLETLQQQQHEEEEQNLTLQRATGRMATEAELAIRTAFRKDSPKQPLNKRYTTRYSKRLDYVSYESDVDSMAVVTMTTGNTARKTRTSAKAALVSDSSTVGSERDSQVVDSVVETDETRIKKFWARLLESTTLQVASRTSNTRGRKRVYEIYHLSSQVSRLDDGSSLDNICSRVETEFRTIFHGDKQDESACRAYAVTSSTSCYIQLNIGKLVDYDKYDVTTRSSSNSGGGVIIKKPKRDKEFVALVDNGSPLIALTAGCRPSRTRLTKFVLAALDAALTHTGSTPTKAKDMIPTRVGDWSGQEPRELLESARAAESRKAVGRFANYAAENATDPLTEIHEASTSSLLDRSAEHSRLEIGAQHGRTVAQLATKNVGSAAPAKLVATNASGTSMILDHSAEAKQGRKRARDDHFGRKGDCPELQRLCWKWTGETSAASACWLAEGETAEDLPKTKFKCGVAMQGTNVFEGLRAMMETGLAEAPLPDFVRDAPTSTSTTITVEHGSVTGNDQFAQV